ncbi:uncharacterized protein LOC112611207 [Theropithecus gelada]|uniref:uncharacterized protein LOC112611207 n=1 Tax=Theropithecus gelada TaxID=9565 RepID=UPI000DC18160|nr:uncharacterized protein LOC112611207 [Theropithecus gelada]
MVSPLPGKYELLYLRPATASYVSPFTHTVTCPAHSRALLALTHSWDSQVRPAVLNPLPRQGNSFVAKQQMSKQQPLRCLIYIEVALSVMSPTVPFPVPVCLSATQRTNPLPEPTRGKTRTASSTGRYRKGALTKLSPSHPQSPPGRTTEQGPWKIRKIGAVTRAGHVGHLRVWRFWSQKDSRMAFARPAPRLLQKPPETPLLRPRPSRLGAQGKLNAQWLPGWLFPFFVSPSPSEGACAHPAQSLSGPCGAAAAIFGSCVPHGGSTRAGMVARVARGSPPGE